MTEITIGVIVAIVTIVLDLIIRGPDKDKDSPLIISFIWAYSKLVSIKTLFSSDYKKMKEELIDFLEKDQSKDGFHKGQFGKNHRVEEEKRYQTSNEKLDTKPRLYLTGRPVYVLQKLLPDWRISRLIHRTIEGLKELLKDGWIRVGAGATQYTVPDGSSTQGAIISYRHTIKAVLILLNVNELFPVCKNVLGRMIDDQSDMQEKEGGWRQCDKTFVQPDLWGSVYALNYLSLVLAKQEELELDNYQCSKIKNALQKTVVWFINEWKSNKWSYGEVKSEENIPILFCETATVFIQNDEEFALLVLGEISKYLDPLGNPTEIYINKLKLIGECAVATRLAYCFYLARNINEKFNQTWLALFNYSVQRKHFGFNSVEAAMLLDMQVFLLKNK